jgi:hypothetical protein
MPEKLALDRLRAISTMCAHLAHQVGKIWFRAGDDRLKWFEIHAIAEELIELRSEDNARRRRAIAEQLIFLRERVEHYEKDKQRVTELEAELKYYRDMHAPADAGDDYG